MSTIFLPFDSSGTSATNLIANEEHLGSDITAQDYTVIAENGLFYTQSFSAAIQSTGQPLVLGNDYSFIGFDIEISKKTAKEVASGIVITNQSKAVDLSIRYQAVGGREGVNNALVHQLIEALAGLSDRTVDFWAAKNKPETYPIGMHKHHVLTDLTGVQVFRDALHDLTNALSSRQVPVRSAFALNNRLSQLENLMRSYNLTVNQVQNALTGFIAGNFAPAGPTGPIGPTGPTGVGITGPRGERGLQGLPGTSWSADLITTQFNTEYENTRSDSFLVFVIGEAESLINYNGSNRAVLEFWLNDVLVHSQYTEVIGGKIVLNGMYVPPSYKYQIKMPAGMVVLRHFQTFG